MMVNLDNTQMFVLLTLQIVALSMFPLYFTTLPAPIRQIHFYVYLAMTLLIGGFMGSVYSVKVIEGLIVSGGSLCYGAFMMTAVMFVWVERNAFILRHLVRLVILVNIFKITLSFLTRSILEQEDVINAHSVPSGMFSSSIYAIIVGGTLIIVELFLLFLFFEFIKTKVKHRFATVGFYILAFVFVLVLDGVVFLFLAFGFGTEIVPIVFGGIPGKVFMAVAFSIPLGLFMLWQRQAFADYLQSNTFHWRLLTSSSADLIKEMAAKDRDAQRGDIVFTNSTEGLAIVDNSGMVLKANAAFENMLGIKSQTAEAADLKNMFWCASGSPAWPQNTRDRRRQEVAFGQEKQHTGILSITPVETDALNSRIYVYSLADITEQKDTRDKLEYLVSHDQLTGLPNRYSLNQQLRNHMRSPYVLIIIDLDRFRDINDSYGHEAGDTVLQVIGQRLGAFCKAKLGANDALFNLSVDAFALIVHSKDRNSIDPILRCIQDSIEQTIRIDENLELFITATIGLSYQCGSGGSNAFWEANTAVYAAKRRRRGSIGIYKEGLITERQRNMELALKLKNALANNELEIHYQPQFDTVNHRIRGVEALVRWTDLSFGVVSPDEFIPVAEATGLIETLGEYVLERACRDGRQWLEEGYTPIIISVNVSASQLKFGRFASVLTKILERTDFPAQQLEIEITESSYIEQEKEVTPFLLDLKGMGVSIAIDDFGTGYSSLSYLRDIPSDYIKIDRSFIVGVPYDTKQCNLVSAIIKLAKAMFFKVVVEGVETKEQLDFVTAHGCDLVQGYYFSPALPKAELEALLERSQ